MNTVVNEKSAFKKELEQTLVVMHIYMDGARLGSSETSWNEIKANKIIDKLKVTFIDDEFEFNPSDNYLSEGGINNRAFINKLNSLGWINPQRGIVDELLFYVTYNVEERMMHYQYLCKIDSSIQKAIDFTHISGWRKMIL